MIGGDDDAVYNECGTEIEEGFCIHLFFGERKY